MLRLTEIQLHIGHSNKDLAKEIAKRLTIKVADLGEFNVFKRSYHVRRNGNINFVYIIDIEVADENAVVNNDEIRNVSITPDMRYNYVAQAPESCERPVVVGFGPCGLFAALLLAQMGFKPIVIERGQNVRQRTKDTFRLWDEGELDTESNVQFGEGGAGTFSDGKLYTRIKDKKFRGRKVMQELIAAGAREEILIVNKPHIGTFRLVKIVENIRANIIALGGEIRFGQKVEALNLDNQSVTGVTLSDGTIIDTQHVIMGIGHSARDTFEMLHEKGVYIEPKSFSIGYRIEHPQSLIDTCQFGKYAGHKQLGSADYKIVHHCQNGRSVYSFCMCPGGTVVAATSEEGRVVTNGMSQYSRNEQNANSGIVVGITPEDFPPGPLGGIELQRELEEKAYVLGGSNYNAPAQLVKDFLKNRSSHRLGSVEPSYKPGIQLCNLSDCLPGYAVAAIREALPEFEKQIPGYAMKDAVLTGVETRTSSPIRIKRDDNMQSINTPGLYPGGEGAGYAGGILSAAVDGIKLAEAVALQLTNQV